VFDRDVAGPMAHDRLPGDAMPRRGKREMVAVVTRGFTGRPRRRDAPVPPGQYVVNDFPVLTAGPTPDVAPNEWELVVTDGSSTRTYGWDAFHALPQTSITVDIHCVTRWSKLGTAWEGVRIDVLLDDADIDVGDHPFAVVSSYGDYTTNLPVADLVERDAMVATRYEGAPLQAEHGGPARLLVPHLYLWKSAKWVREIRLVDDDEPGFWESFGYHMYGDPWLEQRFHGD
jgi:DMSO/TMAO reductase YedYZ molybdopterin-dependent catalytic subunit